MEFSFKSVLPDVVSATIHVVGSTGSAAASAQFSCTVSSNRS
jgi:hypothetical protein